MPRDCPAAASKGSADGMIRPVDAVRSVLELPDAELDYAQAKLAFDRIVDPTVEPQGVLAELDRMAQTARQLAGPAPSDGAKLSAVRKLIYVSGPWNGWRPFEYAHAGFTAIRTKLLSHYLSTRRGNCVSMPILFLILADRLGLSVGLARTPQHLFVRHHGSDGPITNLETTSGAQPARDEWLCQSRGVSQRGIDTGLYMRSLSRRESVGAMALTVVEHLMEQRRFGEAIAVAELLFRNDPTDVCSLLHRSNAYRGILISEFPDNFRVQWLSPLPSRLRYWQLLQCKHDAFREARARGWQPTNSILAKETTPCS